MLFLLLLLFTGCNTIQIEDIFYRNHKIEIADIIERHFTPEAAHAISDIKIYEGFHFHSYVAGVNFWSDFAAFITFNGIGRKIISSQGTLVSGDLEATVIHEYVHQIDDLDRDGEVEVVDHQGFWRAFLEMRRDPSLRAVTDSILDKADRFITNVFGIGPASEIIAYTSSWVAQNPNECPMAMHRALARILKVSAEKCSGANTS